MPLADYELRAYQASDAEPICDIYAHYVRTSVATFDFEPLTQGTIAEKFAVMASKGHPVLIAEKDGKVSGYAYASEYRPRPGYRFTCEDTIYLHPDHLGQGLGSHLLGELIAAAREFGFKQMLGVIASEIEASVRLHQKHGFTIAGRYPNIGHKFGRWVEIVHLQRAL